MNCTLDFFVADTRVGGTHIDFHEHAGYELVYYASGIGSTQIGDAAFEYGGGQFAIIPPRCRHNEYRRSDTYVSFFVFFYDNTPIPLRSGLYTDTSGGRMLELLHRMMEELRGQSSFYEIQLRSLLAQLLVEVGRVQGAGERGELGDKLVYATNYIQQYAGEKLNLPALAASLGYSYDYFRHLFKRETGYSPMQYVVRRRVDLAKALLRDSGKPITAIALECGFGSGPQFSAMFKERTGVSPNEYRRSSRG